MIARHEATGDKAVVWAQISAPLPSSEVQWRQQGKPKQRDGKFFAPFVAYIDAQFVRQRLDCIVPGEWDLALELLPPLISNGDGEATDEPCAFKAKLTILSVVREDVGTGRDYKTASTDAFKRAAVRFGVGHELYTDYEILWVQVDSDSKYAKPLEDPGAAYARRMQRSGANGAGARAESVPPGVSAKAGRDTDAGTARPAAPASAPIDERAPLEGEPTTTPLATDEPSCPKCGGRMWDNRLSKRNPKAPDYKCRSRSCDGVVWPPKSKAQLADEAANGASHWEPGEPPQEIPF